MNRSSEEDKEVEELSERLDKLTVEQFTKLAIKQDIISNSLVNKRNIRYLLNNNKYKIVEDDSRFYREYANNKKIMENLSPICRYVREADTFERNNEQVFRVRVSKDDKMLWKI